MHSKIAPRINTKSNGSSCQNLLDKFIVVDSFGETIELTIPGDRHRYKSLLGTIMTIIILTTIVAYASVKAGELLSDEEANLSRIVQDNYYDDTFVFTAEDNGFDIGIVLLDKTNYTSGHDTRYGELKVYRNEFGFGNFTRK